MTTSSRHFCDSVGRFDVEAEEEPSVLSNDLLTLLQRSTSSPFLFAGSGIGIRYAGLESWEGLLRLFAGKTSHPYEYYVTQAGTNFPRLGSEIARAFSDVWWKSPDYEASRDTLKHLIRDFSTPLKIEIARHIEAKCASLLAGTLPPELELLKDARIDGIVTTNYDPIMEAVFPDYVVYRTQDEAVLSVSQGIAEIYKIHGCRTDPASMVLTAEDYARFEERDSYLAAKLTTLFIEHPVVFVGYSISDENVRRILKAVLRCMPEKWVGKLQDHLIFVEYQKGAGAGKIAPHTLSFDGTTVLPLVRIVAEDYTEIFGALGKLDHKLSVSVLRRIKERVYELVMTTAPKGKLAVVDINDAAHLSDIEVAVGVGLVKAMGDKGYDIITRDDLQEDVLGGERNRFEAEKLVKRALPRLQRKSKDWIPIWGYLKLANLPDAEIPKVVKDAAARTLNDFRAGSAYKAMDVSPYAGVADLAAKEPLSRSAYLILNLPQDKLDVNELRAFLVRTKDQLKSENSGVRSSWWKLVCLLDFLEYLPSAKGAYAA